MATKITKFTVAGQFAFPVDMLRYDACYPATTEDAVEIGNSILPITRRSNADRVFKVTLVTTAINRPTVGRWESFGWKVI